MNCKLFLVVWVVMLCCEKINAQEKLKFKTINHAGLLIGASKPAFQLQSINGVSYQNYFAGIGVGMDNYYFKTIPIFLDLRRNIFCRQSSPFLYADIGAGLPHDRSTKENTWQRSEFVKGLYYDLGIGYTAPVFKKLFISVSLGYSQKNVHEKKIYNINWDFPPYGTHETSEDYDYTFRRLSLKAGLSF